MAPTNIAIIGGTIWGNRGAEAMLETLVGQIKLTKPQVSFKVYSYYPDQDSELVTDPDVTILSAKPIDLVLSLYPGALWTWLCSLLGLRWPTRLLPRGVAELRECSLLLDIAGISFSDGREQFLPFNILCIWPAMLLGVPVGKCSQALGPFRNVFNGLMAKIFLPKCCFIFGRGKNTMAHLSELGLERGLIAEAPDLAFLHRPEFSLSRENDERMSSLLDDIRRTKATGRCVVCFNPSSLVAAKCRRVGIDYPKILAFLARALLERGHGVLFLPTATRKSSGLAFRNNDIAVIKLVIEAIGADELDGGLHWVDWDINFAAIKACMAESDAALVYRFHGLVAALSLNLPSLALGWGHKYGELMEHFGQEEWALDFACTDKSELLQKLLGLLDARDDLRARVLAALPGVQEQSARQLKKIMAALG